jgi:hypothetical protein
MNYERGGNGPTQPSPSFAGYACQCVNNSEKAMKTLLLAATALVAACFSGSLAAEARTSPNKDALIRIIADATAFGEFCVNWSIDPEAVAQFRRRERIAVDGHYREVFGFAHFRAHNQGKRGGNFPASCDRALALYGPRGALAPGLVRSLYHGTVGGQIIDLNR